MSRNSVLYLQCAGLLLAALAFFWLAPTSSHSPSNSSASSSEIDTRASGRLGSYVPDQAFEGVTLVATVGTAEVLLLDMAGKIIHVWPVDAERARLLPNGNILTITGSKWGHDRPPWKELRPVVREYSWTGEVVWEYTADDVLHHDVHRLPGGNTLLLKRAFVPADLQAAVLDPARREKPIRTDSVLEISPRGEVLYQWNAYEHLDLNYCGIRSCASVEHAESDEFLDWTHTNTVNVLPPNKWHQAGDSRFTPGNLLILPRNWWQMLIIDRESGKEVWRYRGTYRGGISGGHDAQMIEPGLPGAGNILVLDNGTSTHRGESIILEINPQSNEIVWTYENGPEFYTRSRGSVQRLPNGNTLIAEDRKGRIFEVTNQGQIVWSYTVDHPTNRAARYPLSYCPVCLRN